MFSQVNSEHCRHKIFNADWTVDGEKSERSLFSMIRNTHQCAPEGTLVAYSDNSSVFEGWPGRFFEVNQENGQYNYQHQTSQLDILCKVETHNHPTAIAPYPGVATGVGGKSAMRALPELVVGPKRDWQPSWSLTYACLKN